MPANQSEVVLIVVISTALILLLSGIVVTGLLIQQRRKHRHQKQLLEMNNLYEKSLLESQLKVQEETFRAISQNLHDNIGSNISTAMLLLYKDEQTNEQELEENRFEALGMLDKIVDDLKNIARSLNAGYLEDIGLSQAIRNRERDRATAHAVGKLWRRRHATGQQAVTSAASDLNLKSSRGTRI